MPVSEIEAYIAAEIRKEVNGANNRHLLSYSKSLGICLLKYNKYADNEIHLNGEFVFDYITYYECKSQKTGFEVYSLDYALVDLGIEKKNKEVILTNFVIDVSDNKLLDSYLLKFTGVGRKKLASPEKDKEVLLFQFPQDLVIKQYSDSVYLLYALVIKYGMNTYIYDVLIDYVFNLEDFRFEFCELDEHAAMIQIIDYIYKNQKLERKISVADDKVEKCLC